LFNATKSQRFSASVLDEALQLKDGAQIRQLSCVSPVVTHKMRTALKSVKFCCEFVDPAQLCESFVDACVQYVL